MTWLPQFLLDLSIDDNEVHNVMNSLDLASGIPSLNYDLYIDDVFDECLLDTDLDKIEIVDDFQISSVLNPHVHDKYVSNSEENDQGHCRAGITGKIYKDSVTKMNIHFEYKSVNKFKCTNTSLFKFTTVTYLVK